MEKADTGDAAVATLHTQYLVERHGRSDLDPLPSTNDADPLNWLPAVKTCQLAMVAFHAFLTTFMAAGVIPAFAIIAEEFGVLITACTYLTLAQIVVLGVFPFVWIPLLNRYGRRQLLVALTVGLMAFNLGCMYARSYGALMACRVLGAVMILPAVAVGAPVVSDLTFSHQRASRTGWWALMITLGTHFGPFLMGFVEYQTGSLKNVFLIFVVMNAVQCVCYVVLGRETLYDHDVWHEGINAAWRVVPRLRYRVKWATLLHPLACLASPKIVVATVAYSVCFLYANVALGVELTSLYHAKYGFNPQQIGMQYIGLIVGSILGEQCGGWMSDAWMRRRPAPEFRLWLSYPGFVCVVVGLVVYGCMLERDSHWTVVPVVGLAIAAFGLQMLTTVLLTYAIDTLPHRASDILLFVTLVRQVLGFVGPFYFPPMLENASLGIRGTYSMLAGLVVALALAPTALVHYFNKG